MLFRQALATPGKPVQTKGKLTRVTRLIPTEFGSELQVVQYLPGVPGRKGAVGPNGTEHEFTESHIVL